MKETNIENVHIEQNDDLIFMTVGKYKFFLAHRKEGGMEAKDLYEHLMFTARLQKTNSVKANDPYLMNGLGWGTAKLKKAKAFLSKYGFIEYKRIRNDDGTLGGAYIVVKASTGSEFEPVVTRGSVDHPVVDQTSGSRRQMLEQGTKCLNKKGNAAAHNDLRAYFESINPEYYHSARQAKAISMLLKRGLTIEAVKNVVCKLLELKKTEKLFWSEQPVVPSTILSLWDNIREAQRQAKPREPARSSLPVVGSPEWKAIYGDEYGPNVNHS